MEHKFGLSELLNDEEFTGATISGIQRLGKSSYALQVMHDVYGNWDDVFNNTFFKIDTLVEYLTKLVESKQRVKCILWDDAGVNGSSQIYWTDKELYRYLGALTDVIGTTTKGLLMTTPNPYGLVKQIRNYEWLIIKITKSGANNGDGRIAKGYLNRMLPSGDRKLRRVFEDRFTKMLPDRVFEKYNGIRLSYNTDVLASFKIKWEESRIVHMAKMAKAANYLERQESEA